MSKTKNWIPAFAGMTIFIKYPIFRLTMSKKLNLQYSGHRKSIHLFGTSSVKELKINNKNPDIKYRDIFFKFWA